LTNTHRHAHTNWGDRPGGLVTFCCTVLLYCFTVIFFSNVVLLYLYVILLHCFVVLLYCVLQVEEVTRRAHEMGLRSITAFKMDATKAVLDAPCAACLGAPTGSHKPPVTSHGPQVTSHESQDRAPSCEAAEKDTAAGRTVQAMEPAHSTLHNTGAVDSTVHVTGAVHSSTVHPHENGSASQIVPSLHSGPRATGASTNGTGDAGAPGDETRRACGAPAPEPGAYQSQAAARKARRQAKHGRPQGAAASGPVCPGCATGEKSRELPSDGPREEGAGPVAKGGGVVPKAFPPRSFDRVLLDGPCSALGLRPRLFAGSVSFTLPPALAFLIPARSSAQGLQSWTVVLS